MVPYVPPWKKKWGLMGGVSPVEGTINQPDPNAQFRQNPFPGMIDPNWSVASTFPAKTPQHSSAMGGPGGKWKKVIEQLGKMTGPEPDWSLSPQKMGVPSPWSPTNVAWSPVGADMFGRKKKKGPY